MDLKLFLQIVGVVLGLLYLYLEYKADIRLWVVGLIMPWRATWQVLMTTS